MPFRLPFSFLPLTGVCLLVLVWVGTAKAADSDVDGTATISGQFKVGGDSDYLRVDGGTANIKVTDTGSITTEDGNGIYVNGETTTRVDVSNLGTIAVTGKGWGIYAYPSATNSTSVNVNNVGTLERIQLAETDGSTVTNSSGGVVSGSVLLGTKGLISNYGELKSKDDDFALNNRSNLISFEREGTLVNGLLSAFNANNEITGATFFAQAVVSTDHLQFANAGTISNAGTINNKTITLLNEGAIYNIANPYNISNADAIDKDGPSIQTDVLTMGNESLIRGDQGTNTTIGTMTLGDDADLLFGDTYVLPYQQTVTIETKATDGTVTKTEKVSSQVPKIAVLNVTTGQIGDGAEIKFLNGAQYNGETLRIGDSGTMDVQGGKITMAATDTDNPKTTTLAFGNNGVFNLSSYYRPEVVIDEVASGSTGTAPTATEKKLEPILFTGKLTTDVLSFGDNGTVNLTGVSVKADTINFGDYGTLNGTEYAYSATSESSGIGNDTAGTGGTGFTDAEKKEIVTDVFENYKAYASLDSDAFITSVLNAANGVNTDEAVGYIYTLLQGEGAFDGISDEQAKKEAAQAVLKQITDTLNGQTATSAVADTAATTDTSTTTKDYVVGSSIEADNVNFAHHGSVTAGQGLTLTAQNATFKDHGTVTNYGQFNVDKLQMGEYATLNTYNEMKTAVVVDSHSRANLLSAATDTTDTTVAFGALRGGSITGGFEKAAGATDVEIISATDYGYHGYLANRINVDKVTVQQNMLHLEDVDLSGRIEIGTDAWLRLGGTQANIYDPIARVDGATNTTIEVALDDDVFYTTRNTIDVDHLLISGGGLEITRPVNIGDIQLDSDTTVRVTGNFAVGDLTEVKGNAVNTTFSVKAGTGNAVNSSGDITLDRVMVESGIYNAYNKITAVNDREVSDIDGIELGTDAVLNVYNTLETGRVVRQQNVTAGTVSNTTINVAGADMFVNKNMDLDTLTLDNGRFVFLNQQGNNAINVTNTVSVGSGSVLAGTGVLNVKSGALQVTNGGHLAVSVRPVTEQKISNLVVTENADTITDTSNLSATNSVDVTVEKGGFLDVRADGSTNDIIGVDGTLTLDEGARVIIRNAETDVTYTVAQANNLNASADDVRYSFLWKDTAVTTNNNQLGVTIGDIQTLRQGIAETTRSKNTDGIADALTAIQEQVGLYTTAEFLDNVFYADSAGTAVALMNEYAGEGYLNAQTAALRTMQSFRQGATDALDNLRAEPLPERRLTQRRQVYQTQRPAGQTRPVRRVYQRRYPAAHQNLIHYTPTIYNPSVQGGYSGQAMYQSAYAPVYYGRSGGDSYRSYVQRRPQFNKRKRVRTDRGGLWLNPFVSRVTQDAKNGIAGYDYDSYGLTVGADRKFGALSLGLTGLVAQGELKQTAFKSDISSYGVGLYGSYQPRTAHRFIDFYALWATNAHKGERRINSLAQTVKADYDVTALSAGAAVGYQFEVTPNLTITPRVGLDYTRVTADDIREQGNTPALLELSPEDFTSLKTPLELKAAMRFGDSYNQLLPEVHARWTHEFGDTAPEAKATFVNYQVPFGVSGLETDSDSFVLGGSLAWLTGASELSLKYDYEFSSGLTGHTFNAGYKYSF